MNRRVLIVEDNDINRKLMADVLKYYKYEVMEAINGTEGIRMAKENRPDMILMDMQMPVMDGLTAIRILKKDPETKGIRIIAVTSFAMKGDKERIMEAGADDYIAKPVDTRQLPDVIKKHLGGGEVL